VIGALLDHLGPAAAAGFGGLVVLLGTVLARRVPPAPAPVLSTTGSTSPAS
jgi:hypothetical protein